MLDDQTHRSEKEVLKAAMMAEFNQYPFSDAARAFIAKLIEWTLKAEDKFHPRKRKRQVDAERAFYGSIAAFAADLILHSSREASEGFMYRPSDRDELSSTLVSSRAFTLLLQLWESMELLETTSSIHKRDEHPFDRSKTITNKYVSKARRMRAKDKLIDLALTFGITSSNIRKHFGRDASRVQLVTVKTASTWKKGRKVRGTLMRFEGPLFEKRKEEVHRINKILSKSKFSLTDTPRVRRIFNDGDTSGKCLNRGGRLYCTSMHDWQGMPSVERAGLTWDGGQVCEVDVSASYLTILYGMKGSQMSTCCDPYDLPGIDRNIVKGLLVAWFGNGHIPKRWPRDLAKEYEVANGRKLSSKHKLEDVLHVILKKHPVLCDVREGYLDWGEVQFQESECFIAAILELGEMHGIVALPVHDSLIVAEEHIQITKHVISDAYHRRFGVVPILK